MIWFANLYEAGFARATPDLARRFAQDQSGAVAALYALAMFALVAIAGVAWDWTRMTAMDSELQNAADQAALAAATQLDGLDGAITRATDAANDLVSNVSRMSNDGNGPELTVQSIAFFDGYDQVIDAFGNATTDDGQAQVVRIAIAPRETFFVLTPLVSVLRSGDISAEAAAALGSAICNTPPVMMCNPLEDDNGTFDADEVFDPANYVGHGLRLITDDAGAPGNFGFLANGLGTGASNLARALGHDSQVGNCVAGTGVTTEPGLKDVVFDAINTRFDLDTNGANTCPDGDANCSAAPVVRKDLVKGSTGSSHCGVAPPSSVGGRTWRMTDPGRRYAPTLPEALTPAQAAQIEVMGLPRDYCHATSENGECPGNGVLGTGEWDRDAYFRINFGWEPENVPTAVASDTISRYDVYKWEAAHLAQGTGNGLTVGANKPITAPSNFHGIPQPVCRSTGDISRRILTIAVINCDAEGVAGRSVGVPVHRWVEVFMVEPSYNRLDNAGIKRTDANDVYVEIIRAIDVGGDGEAGEVVRRDVPYLIR